MARAVSVGLSPFAVAAAPPFPFSATTWASRLISVGGYTDADIYNVFVQPDDGIYLLGTVNAGQRFFVMKTSDTATPLWAQVSGVTNVSSSGNLATVAFTTPAGLAIGGTSNSALFVAYDIANTSSSSANAYAHIKSYHTANGAVRDEGLVLTGNTITSSTRFRTRDTIFTSTWASAISSNTTTVYGFMSSNFPLSTSGGVHGAVMMQLDSGPDNILLQRVAGGAASPTGNFVTTTTGWVAPNGAAYHTLTNTDIALALGPAASKGPKIWSYTSAGNVTYQKTYIRVGTGTTNTPYYSSCITGRSSNLASGGIMATTDANTTQQAYVMLTTASTGAVLWAKQYVALGSGNCIADLVMPGDNYIYFSTKDGHIGRLFEANGDIQWTKRVIGAKEIAVSNGFLYVVAGGAFLKILADGSDLPIGNTVVGTSGNVRVLAVSNTTTTSLTFTVQDTSLLSSVPAMGTLLRPNPVANSLATNGRLRLT